MKIATNDCTIDHDDNHDQHLHIQSQPSLQQTTASSTAIKITPTIEHSVARANKSDDGDQGSSHDHMINRGELIKAMSAQANGRNN
jgi:hypothetical protein